MTPKVASAARLVAIEIAKKIAKQTTRRHSEPHRQLQRIGVDAIRKRHGQRRHERARPQRHHRHREQRRSCREAEEHEHRARDGK